MLIPLALAFGYVLFLLWHEPWLVRRLRPGEAVEVLGNAYDDFSAAERERFVAFMDADDGRSFCMVNLLEYRERADYRPGTALNGSTPTGIIGGRDAGWRYGRAMLPELLKRACYPLFFAGTLASSFPGNAGGESFDDVVVVRYRSRRDLLALIASPAFRHAVPHKWASLERSVAVPCRRLLLVDPAALVPLVIVALVLLLRQG